MTVHSGEEYEMELEVIAGVIAELDEDNIHVLDAVNNLLNNLLANNTSKSIDVNIHKCLNIISDIQSGGIDFVNGYRELCNTFEKVRNGNDDSTDTARAEKARRPQASLSPEDREDMQLQLDVIDGLLEDHSEVGEHVFEVMRNLLKKVSSISSLGSETTDMLETTDDVLRKLVHGDFEREQGFSILDETLEKLRCVCNENPAAADETGGSGSAVGSALGVVDAEPVPGSGEPAQIESTLQLSDGEIAEFIAEIYDYIDFAEAALLTLEKNTADKESLNEVFRCFHNIKGITGFMNIADMNELAHHAESLMDKARDGRLEFAGAISEVVFEALDFIKEMTARIEISNSGTPYITPDGLEKLIASLENPDSCAGPEAPVRAPQRAYRNGDRVRAGATDIPAETESAPQPCSAVNTPARAATKTGNIRVSTERLDNLVDSVGELVIANSVVFQGISGLNGQITKRLKRKLIENANHLGKVTRELQELAMSMRMVPLAATFNKMARVARDTFLKSGVSGEFSYSGEDTEIDRNVVEELASPLMHMIRNSIDHGIEAVEDRRAAGKPEKGRVHLSAAHESGNVVIRIEDDGRGLDREAILSKAESLGIVMPGIDISDEEIYELIFHPGFSTAEKVTDVSGRGVGMDVVRRNIEKLRGVTEIDSRPGEGCTFTIRLPLTLAIIDGMMVTVGQEHFVVPTIAIQESIRPTREQLSSVLGKGEMVNVRGVLVPLFRLHDMFCIEGAKQDPCDALVLLLGGGTGCALLVDELLGQQQVVIKKLGKVFDNVEGIAGGAIMGDGNVALIIDPVGISKTAQAQGAAS